MELTPIKVRGKRHLSNKSADVSPPKRFKSKSKSKSKSKPKAKLSLKERASAIENKLPLEIMEEIFWLSGNCNLPRASPLIGRLLSNRSTLQMTFMEAFKPTWYFFGFEEENPMPAEDDFIGDPKLQSDLLECPWANVPFIFECWNLYVKQRAEKQMESYLSSETMVAFDNIKLRFDDDPEHPRQYGFKDINCLEHPEKILQCFFDDYAVFRAVEEDPSEFYYNRQEFMNTTYHHVHEQTRIPDSLLTSPLDEESLQKFFWLLRSGAKLAPDQDWELTLQAYRHAVPLASSNNQPSLTVVRILAALNAFQDWPDYIVEQEVGKLDAFWAKVVDVITDKDKASWSLWHWKYIRAQLLHDRYYMGQQEQGVE